MKPKRLIIHIITSVAPSNHLTTEEPLRACDTGSKYARPAVHLLGRVRICDGAEVRQEVSSPRHLLQSDTVI